MRWNSLLLKKVSRATKNLACAEQLLKRFSWIVQAGRQGPLVSPGRCYSPDLASFSPASSEAGLPSPLPLPRLQFLRFLQADLWAPGQPLAPAFPLHLFGCRFTLLLPFLASRPLLQEQVRLTTWPTPSWVPPGASWRRPGPGSGEQGLPSCWNPRWGQWEDQMNLPYSYLYPLT